MVRYRHRGRQEPQHLSASRGVPPLGGDRRHRMGPPHDLGHGPLVTDAAAKRRLWSGVFTYDLDDFEPGGPTTPPQRGSCASPLAAPSSCAATASTAATSGGPSQAFLPRSPRYASDGPVAQPGRAADF